RPGSANAAAFVVAFVCAQLTKFSALALIPIVAVLLPLMVVRRGTLGWRSAAWLAVGLTAATVAGVWAVYGCRHAPRASRRWLYRAHAGPVVPQRLPTLAAVVRWIDARHLLPNAYSEGLLLSQAKARVREAFLAGAISQTGWWYYFPVAFALK